MFHILSEFFYGQEFSELGIERSTIADKCCGQWGITNKSFLFVVDFTGTLFPSCPFTRQRVNQSLSSVDFLLCFGSLCLKFVLNVELLLWVFFQLVQLLCNDCQLFSGFFEFFLGDWQVGFFLCKLDFLWLDDLRLFIILVDGKKPFANGGNSLGDFTCCSLIEPFNTCQH